ncbi:MAG TPA: UbiA family prenyltransferase [Methylomirabilota bacterium]|nr:UbiA family prenyltransferase [Methylomirabilota bacterium]
MEPAGDSQALRPPLWRTLLVLGRVSNLPTVWSNCLAGWLLGGGGSIQRLLELMAAATCLYTAGMYLNDAFDAGFDQEFRSERPIPRGDITNSMVWTIGLGLLALGVALLLPLGTMAVALGATLAANILIYDAVHKQVSYGPVIMAGCRFFLFLLAAEVADGANGFVLWWALALALYIIGLSYIARCESKAGLIGYWPLVLMAAPLVVGWFAYAGPYRVKELILLAALALWILRSVRFTFWMKPPQVGKTVSSLLAGIVIVDLLAVAGATPMVGAIFLTFFVLCLIFQRFIPAT